MGILEMIGMGIKMAWAVKVVVTPVTAVAKGAAATKGGSGNNGGSGNKGGGGSTFGSSSGHDKSTINSGGPRTPNGSIPAMENGKPVTRGWTERERNKFQAIRDYIKNRLGIDIFKARLQKYQELRNKYGKIVQSMQVSRANPYMIRVSASIWSSDYSANRGKLDMLAHELGHTVGYALGYGYSKDPSMKNEYSTPHKSGQKFDGYHTEQQGELMRGLFHSLDGARAGASLNSQGNRAFSREQYDAIFSH